MPKPENQQAAGCPESVKAKIAEYETTVLDYARMIPIEDADLNAELMNDLAQARHALDLAVAEGINQRNNDEHSPFAMACAFVAGVVFTIAFWVVVILGVLPH
ncbi:MAG: hypothetical protein ACPG4X_19260 [Pikeienuella sp.]